MQMGTKLASTVHWVGSLLNGLTFSLRPTGVQGKTCTVVQSRVGRQSGVSISERTQSEKSEIKIMRK